MSYSAKVFRILIASPSDVHEERNIISNVIQEWNDLYSYDKKVVLLPLRWETHSSPELGSRPQEIINREVVDLCDMSIGVFWTRIGTSTGKAEGGTIEEIERVGNAGKIVMLYFSKAKVDLDYIDFDQYNKLKEFKATTYPNGLVENYSDLIEFKNKLTKQLEIKVRTLINQHSKNSEKSKIVDSNPNIEIGFVNPLTQELLRNEITIFSKAMQFKNFNKVPDFTQSKANITSNADNKINIINDVNRNYYREYINFVKNKEFYKPIQLFLFNPSSIHIRDIHIEINIGKKDEIALNQNKFLEPSKSSNLSHIMFDRYNNTPQLYIVDKDNYFFIMINIPALQPQRKIILDNIINFGVAVNKTLISNALIYADCFSQPLEHKLVVKAENDTVEIDSIEFLMEVKS